MPIIRQKVSKTPKQPAPPCNPYFPEGYKDPLAGFFGTGPICGVTSPMTATEIEEDLKLIKASPYPTSSIETRRDYTPERLNESEEMKLMVKRLMDSVSLALVPVAPQTAVRRPRSKAPKTRIPPCSTTTSPGAPLIQSLASYISSKSTQPCKATIGATGPGRKPRLPLGNKDINIVSRAAPRRAKKLKVRALRAAGMKIFINRAEYQKSKATPRAAPAQI